MSFPRVEWIPLEEWASAEQRRRVVDCWSHPQLLAVTQALQELGIACLLVGGVVRDLLLERDNKDLDLVVECSAETLYSRKSRLARSTGASPVALDRERGILRLCFRGGVELDLVSLQAETLYDDLLRRDLTINAMALSAEGGLMDPFQGRHDLERRVLRVVRCGNFLDDPLRTVRGLRFAAQLLFGMEDETWNQLLKAVPGLERVAGERIRVELRKFFEHARFQQIDMLLKSGLRETLFPGFAGFDRYLRQAPPGWLPGLAAWLAEGLAQEAGREQTMLRLKLSRKEKRWLDGWARGVELLRNDLEWSTGEIYDLSMLAGPAFTELAGMIQEPDFPIAASAETREAILRESQQKGRLRFQPVPWNGTQIAESLGRSSGPWMKQAVETLDKAWALREIESLEEGMQLLKRAEN